MADQDEERSGCALAFGLWCVFWLWGVGILLVVWGAWLLALVPFVLGTIALYGAAAAY